MSGHKNAAFLKETLLNIIDYLESYSSKNQLRHEFNPDELKNAFNLSIKEAGIDKTTLTNSLRKVVEYSVNTNHPFFMNQMYGSQQIAAIIGDIISSLLNTSMYTYEAAPLLTLIEKECIEKLGNLVWLDQKETDGVFTPGGSISNMMAMVMARDNKFPHSKKDGIKNIPECSIFVSELSHYSFLKNSMVLGFGEDSIVKIRSDQHGEICTSSLEIAILEEKEKGRSPLMIVGTAGVTTLGAIDNLSSLASIAKKNNLWYHIDAVYGGSLLFSQKHNNKLAGIENADSVSWNLHKMMGIPIICSVLLTKKKYDLEKSFSASASYLFHDNDAEFDLGHKSLQCGRRVDALKLWTAWQYAGNEGFEKRIDTLMEKTHLFANKLKQDEDFELYCEPGTPILCFQYKPTGIKLAELNELNKNIRGKIFEDGNILFNYIQINEKVLIRCVISDDEISEAQIDLIINTIKNKGQSILNSCVKGQDRKKSDFVNYA